MSVRTVGEQHPKNKQTNKNLFVQVLKLMLENDEGCLANQRQTAKPQHDRELIGCSCSQTPAQLAVRNGVPQEKSS